MEVSIVQEKEDTSGCRAPSRATETFVVEGFCRGAKSVKERKEGIRIFFSKTEGQFEVFFLTTC